MRFFLVVFFLLTVTSSAFALPPQQIKTHTLVSDKLVTGVTDAVRPLGANRTFQAFGNVSATTGAATVVIEVSNDGVNYVVADTLTLTLGTAVTSDSYETDAAWKYVRGNVTAISGTDAKVSLIMGAEL